MSFTFEPTDGMPPEEDSGPFLIEHADYGFMMAKWNTQVDAFVATGFSKTDRLPFQAVSLIKEQVAKCLRWFRLPNGDRA